MDFMSIITAAATQASSAISTFLGLAAYPAGVQTAVLVAIVLVVLAAIALVLYLGAKMLGKIFGGSNNDGNLPGKQQKQGSGKKPSPTFKSALQQKIEQDEALNQQAIAQIEERNACINGLDKLKPEDKMLITEQNTGVIPLCDLAVKATKAALDSALQLRDEITDPAQKALIEAQIEERGASYAAAQLYLQRAQELHAHSTKLYNVSEQKQKIYNGTRSAQGAGGNEDALAQWTKAYNIFKDDFDTIKDKLESIEKMNPEQVKAAIVDKNKDDDLGLPPVPPAPPGGLKA